MEKGVLDEVTLSGRKHVEDDLMIHGVIEPEKKEVMFRPYLSDVVVVLAGKEKSVLREKFVDQRATVGDAVIHITRLFFQFVDQIRLMTREDLNDRGRRLELI